MNMVDKENIMAKIVENIKGRRIILVSTDDVINIVREYQTITQNKTSYKTIRAALDDRTLFIPEEV